MTMTTTQAIITIAAVVLGTMATRFIPFIIFPEGKNPPEFIKYLGTVLPYAAIGLLYRTAPQVEKKHPAEYRWRNRPVYDTGPDCFSLIHKKSPALCCKNKVQGILS